MKLLALLEALGMSTLEQDIYLCVTKYHKTTASTVATQLNRERTSTYKRMKQMVGAGRLMQTHERGTSFFLAVDLRMLQERFLKQLADLQTIHTNRDEINHEYTALQSAHQFDTSIKLLSGTESIRYAYQTMQQLIEQSHYIAIRCMSTHTIEALSGGADSELSALYEGFYTYLTQKNIQVSSHLCEGLSLMESILHTHTRSSIISMPVSNDATTIRIVGDDMFLLLFTQEPQTIHIHSSHVSGLMRFFLEQLESR